MSEAPEDNLQDETHKLFQIGHLERIVSGGLRSCIKAHGPIDRNWVGSAAKRIAQNLRGHLVQYSGQTANDIALARYKQELADENQRLHELNASLRKQRDDLLEKLRKGEPLNGA